MLLAGTAAGVESLAIARRSPGYSFAATSGPAAALELAAGWALVLAGSVAFRRPGRRAFGGVLALAGLAWFVSEWNNPGAGSAFVFTAGLVASAAAPVLVAHAVLRYPDRRLDPAERVAVVAGYLGAVALEGFVPALLLDPAGYACSECPANLIAAAHAPAAHDNVLRAATYAGIAWSVLLLCALGRGVVRSSPARRRIVAPILGAAMIYVAAAALDYLHSSERGYLSDDVVDRRLWIARGVLSIVIALATGWAFVRTRLTRSAVARLVVEAADVAAPGGIARALGKTLRDPSLQVRYRRADGRYVDDTGAAIEPATGSAVTRLTRGGETVAELIHRPGLFDGPGAADEIADGAGLAMDNERLQAERRAQLTDLRASRARIVATADAERRRLERDLHDGAQQRLVTLSLGVRLARLRLGADADPAVVARLEDTQVELTAALSELRGIARGIYPRELADEGLPAGLETMAESSPIPISVTAPLAKRLAPQVESAAYFAVSRCVGRCAGDRASVRVTRDGGRLRVEIAAAGLSADLVDVEDRVGALAGTVEVRAPDEIWVELPCES